MIATCVALAGCKPPAAKSSKGGADPPAKVAQKLQESKLNELTLAEEAEKRLGIEIAAAEVRSVERLRTFGGEVTVPLGASIIVSAPFSGTLAAPNTEGIPAVGTLVSQKQPMVKLVPLLLPIDLVRLDADRADAERLIEEAQERVKAAQIEVDRAQHLLENKVGTKQTLDTAKAVLAQAEKSLDGAIQRKKVLDQADVNGANQTATPLLIEAPQNGIVRALQATAGEAVNAGAPLFEVLNYDRVWIRVPIYVGELATIAQDRDAHITTLSQAPGSKGLAAHPVPAPPTAPFLTSAVDLYYELDNMAHVFRPSQKVGATLVLQGESKSLVVPWSAIIQDVHGGEWVYERLAPHTYARRRVEVAYIVASQAVIAQGLAKGAPVVVTGAAELFGTEFGFAK